MIIFPICIMNGYESRFSRKLWLVVFFYPDMLIFLFLFSTIVIASIGKLKFSSLWFCCFEPRKYIFISSKAAKGDKAKSEKKIYIKSEKTCEDTPSLLFTVFSSFFYFRLSHPF